MSGEDLYRKGMDLFSGSNGSTKDYGKAVEYFRLAEQKGFYNGDLFYGFCLMTGQGVTKDVKEGIRRYARAASTGDRQSLYFFGDALEAGIGVRRNSDIAKRYFAESARKGEQKAIDKLKDSYGITDYSKLSIDWRNSERFLTNNRINGNNNDNNKFSSFPTFTWLLYENNVNNSDYTFKVGVKSSSRVLSSSVYVNEVLVRGINTVINDGYDYMFNPTVKLNRGKNTVKVSVSTSEGTFVSEKTVVYNRYSDCISTGDKRIALVLGNSAYNAPNLYLPNPVNDANDVASKLSNVGFKVIKAIDLGQREIEKTIVEFGKDAQNYDIALFYYAGHGVSTHGINYIIPIDAILPSEDAVRYKCVDVNMALDVMESAGCPMKIVVLDACRNNPFARSWHRSVDTSGLSTMNAPKGTFISFSTAPGEVAADGILGERNSPYTSAFLNALDKPGLTIHEFFQDILDQVAIKTNEQQTPWTSSSFRGKFIFNPKL